MSEQTNEQIAARALASDALKAYYGIPNDERAPEADEIAAAVVAALAEAGRLVPEGYIVAKPDDVLRPGEFALRLTMRDEDDEDD